MSTFGQFLLERRAAFANKHGRPASADEEDELRDRAADDVRAAEAVRQERSHERRVRNLYFFRIPGATEQEWLAERDFLVAATEDGLSQRLTAIALERSNSTLTVHG